MESGFIFVERPISDKKSISSLINVATELEQKNNPRLPQTIHGSGYWQCPHKMLLEAYGVPYTDYNFNWSNQQAAKSGDYGHLQIQEELVKNGLAIKIPAYNLPDEVSIKKARSAGLTENAIEVDLTKFSLPYTATARKKYKDAGFFTHDEEYHKLLRHYRLGIRIDSVIRLPWYQRDMPLEIKTVKPEYWEGGKNHRLFAAKMEKYMYQLQMQMAWWKDSQTGETPEWGIIYVVNRADTSKRIERYVRYDSDFIDSWLPKILQIKEAWEKGELLEPVPEPTECGFCPFYSRCPSPDKYPPIQKFIAAAKAKKQYLQEMENGY